MSKLRVVIKPAGFIVASLTAMVLVIGGTFIVATEPEWFRLPTTTESRSETPPPPSSPLPATTPAPTASLPPGAKQLTKWLVLRPVPTGFTGLKSTDEAERKLRLTQLMSMFQLPDEGKLDPKAGDSVTVGGSTLRWVPVTAGTMDLTTAQSYTKASVGPSYVVAYAVTTVEVPKAMSNATLYVGSDDAVAVWLNGKEVWRNAVLRGCIPGQDKVPALSLNAGRNVLVFKVGQADGEWVLNAALETP